MYYRACTHTYSAGFATGSTEAWLRKPRTACNHMQAAAEYQEYPVRRPTNATTCLAYLRCVCCLGVAGVPAGPQPRRVWSLAPSTKSRWVAGHVPTVGQRWESGDVNGHMLVCFATVVDPTTSWHV